MLFFQCRTLRIRSRFKDEWKQFSLCHIRQQNPFLNFQSLASNKLKEKQWKHSILLFSCYGKCFFRGTKFLFILWVKCKVLAQKKNVIFYLLRFKICIPFVQIYFLCTASTVPDRRRVSHTVWFVFNPTYMYTVFFHVRKYCVTYMLLSKQNNICRYTTIFPLKALCRVEVIQGLVYNKKLQCGNIFSILLSVYNKRTPIFLEHLRVSPIRGPVVLKLPVFQTPIINERRILHFIAYEFREKNSTRAFFSEYRWNR